MGLLTQALAGAAEGGASAEGAAITTQNQQNFQMMLENSRNQAQQNLVQLSSTLQAQNASALSAQNAQQNLSAQTVGVDNNGIPITRSDYSNMTADQKGDVQSPQAYGAQTNLDYTPIGMKSDGSPLLPSDLTPDGPPSGSILNIQMQQAMNAANIQHLNSETFKNIQTGNWMDNRYSGGWKGQSAEQMRAAGMSEIEIAKALQQQQSGGGANGGRPTSEQIKSVNDLRDQADTAISAGQIQKGKDILAERNQMAAQIGMPSLEYVQDTPATTKNKGLIDSTQVPDKPETGHIRLMQNQPGQNNSNLNQSQRQVESGNKDFSVNGQPVTSSQGARYAMQVMPNTAANPGFGVRPADPKILASGNQQAISAEYNRVGQDYMNALLQKYNGNLPVALAAYNQGPGATDTWLNNSKGDLNKLPPETQTYLVKVLGMMNQSKSSSANSSSPNQG